MTYIIFFRAACKTTGSPMRPAKIMYYICVSSLL